MKQDNRDQPSYHIPAGSEPNVKSGNAFFMDYTISTDATAGDSSTQRDTLPQLSKKAGEEPQGNSFSQQSNYALGDIEHPRPLHQDIADDGPDVSDRQQRTRSRWPEIQTNEMAQWRRRAMERRATLKHTAAVKLPTSDPEFDAQIRGDTTGAIHTLRGCNEVLAGASAANEESHSPQLPALGSEFIEKTTVDAENCAFVNEQDRRGEITFPGPRDAVQNTPVAVDAFPHDRSPEALPPNMSEALNAITEQFLNIDILDERQDLSRFIGYLLDTVELLTSRIAFLEAKDAKFRADRSDSDSQSFAWPGDHSNVFVGKVIHRVLCSNRSHQHDRAYYEDQPTYVNRQPGGRRKLMGNSLIHSLDSHLVKHSNLSFIIVKDHDCTTLVQQQGRADEETSRRAFGPRRERIQIVAPLLQEALLQVAEYDPIQRGGNIDSLKDKGMDAPYPFLFHHHRKLVELARDETYEGVLNPLLEFLATNYGKEYDEATSLFNEGFVTGRHLTKLFKPNQMVISQQESNGLGAYILCGCHTPARGKIMLEGWSWKYDGNQLDRHSWSREVDGVLDERMRISDLGIHPAEFARAEDISILEKRGRQFWNMRDQAYVCYTGWDQARQYHYVEERFMVDMATYKLMHPTHHSPGLPAIGESVQSQGSAGLDPWPQKIYKTEEISEKAVMLLPGTIFGFRLQVKKWSNLLVDNCHSIKWNQEAFERLVLDDDAKKMIYALVNTHNSPGKMDDIIAGKGNGLIILLHGSPGTGKTLTAESVAEIVERPLYRVTCGDIGTDPKDAEKYLETIFHLGKTWNCVLLLDEADVFLEERVIADMQRNSLVSIFIRALEYYDGILILTSNRVGFFDEAFKSRIQVAIQYKTLTRQSRKKIWSNFLDMIEESGDEEANMAVLKRRLDELARHELNGRQIRNILLTARQLAEHEGERLDWKHLSHAIRTAVDFDRYLTDVRGFGDDELARLESMR